MRGRQAQGGSTEKEKPLAGPADSDHEDTNPNENVSGKDIAATIRSETHGCKPVEVGGVIL